MYFFLHDGLAKNKTESIIKCDMVLIENYIYCNGHRIDLVSLSPLSIVGILQSINPNMPHSTKNTIKTFGVCNAFIRIYSRNHYTLLQSFLVVFE